MSLMPETTPVDVVAAALRHAGLDPDDYHLADIVHDLHDDSTLHIREAVHTGLFRRIARDNRRS